MKILMLIMLFLTLFSACEKKPVKPSTNVEKIEYLTHNSCTVSVNYNFGSYNEANTKQGLCFSLNPEPSMDDNILLYSNIIDNMANKRVFFLVGLQANTTYFVRSYIIPVGEDEISYSSATEFKTKDVEYFTDARDNKKYPVIKIDEDHWIAENLSYEVVGNSWYYDNDNANMKYGRLYNYEGALAAIPDGWHLPTDEEWTNLEKNIYLEDSLLSKDVEKGRYEASKLKQIGSDFWYNPGGTNETGFTALPGGFFGPKNQELGINEQFSGLSTKGFFLTSTAYDDDTIWVRKMIDSDNKIYRQKELKERGFSVRCIKNK